MHSDFLWNISASVIPMIHNTSYIVDSSKVPIYELINRLCWIIVPIDCAEKLIVVVNTGKIADNFNLSIFSIKRIPYGHQLK